MPATTVPFWGWLSFGAIVAVALAIDLFLHRHGRVDRTPDANLPAGGRHSWTDAVAWSIAWIGLALLFNIGVALVFGRESGEEFLSAYLLEKSLSIDNLFVFLLVFQRLAIPAGEERRILTWGILGAVVTRGVFIALGATLLERFHQVTYVFGAILAVAAVRMFRNPKEKAEKKGVLLPWLQRHIPLTEQFHGAHFIVRAGTRWVATPMLLALITIELTDIVFAIDSIPAAFAVTERPVIVYSSNVFAIFGLRSLYVVISRAVKDLEYLHIGLGAILLFAGAKMLAAAWVTVPAWLSLAIIAVCGTVAVLASLRARRTRSHDQSAHA